jgi:hypothetical protein
VKVALGLVLHDADCQLQLLEVRYYLS